MDKLLEILYACVEGGFDKEAPVRKLDNLMNNLFKEKENPEEKV